MATIREAAVELMRNLVTDPSRYYAQNTGQSWSNLTTKTVFGYNVQVPAGPMDCIGSVTAVYKALGLLNHGLYTSTRDVRVDICDGVKFILTEWLDDYVMQPGDMPLCERPQKVGHISMCTVGGWLLGRASALRARHAAEANRDSALADGVRSLLRCELVRAHAAYVVRDEPLDVIPVGCIGPSGDWQ